MAARLAQNRRGIAGGRSLCAASSMMRRSKSPLLSGRLLPAARSVVTSTGRPCATNPDSKKPVAAARFRRVNEFWCEALDPSVDGDVIHFETLPGEEFLNVTV
jgi:hypothetical protein